MPGELCIDAKIVLRRLQEKYVEKKRQLYYIFVDPENAFDQGPTKAIEWSQRRQGIIERLIRLVMCLYNGTTTKV